MIGEYRKLVALGSSFAAGPGIEPVADTNAMRSTRNYAHLLADRLDAELIDLTVSGATTATILHTPQLTATGVQYPPQIDGLPEDADLVTLTAGGNDLEFAGSMLYAAWSRAQPDSPLTDMLGAGFPSGTPEPTDRGVESMAQGLIDIAAEIRHRAPWSRVVLVDYLTVIDDGPQPAEWPFSADETEKFRRMQRSLARGYTVAAKRSGAELLRASALSEGHGLGSADAWVFDFQQSIEVTGSSFHPNEAGMSMIADALESLLHS